MDEIEILVINLRLWHYFLEADPPPHTHTHTHTPHIQIRTHVTTGFIPYVTTLHRVEGTNCKESVKRHSTASCWHPTITGYDYCITVPRSTIVVLVI